MVYLKVRMSGFVYTSEQEIGIMRHGGIQEFTCFHTFCPFHPEITISRSLEGKYTFLGGICWVLSREVRIGDLVEFKVFYGVLESAHVGIRVHFGTGNRDYASWRNSGIHLFFTLSALFTLKSPFLGL